MKEIGCDKSELLYQNGVIKWASNSATPSWANEPCMVGIDEAGRGPVLGPMVYGSAFCPISSINEIKKKSYADSKTLSEAKREVIFTDIGRDTALGYTYDYSTATDISNTMFRRDERITLNDIAFNSTCKCLQTLLDGGVNIKEVYCDTVGKADKWRDKLRGKFKGIKFTVCPRADSMYPIVSAASIVAKVTRDRMLRDHQYPEKGLKLSGAPIGSGYPSDPTTVKWLKGNVDPIFGFPEIVRFSWQTVETILKDKGVAMMWPPDDESSSNKSSQKTLKLSASKAHNGKTASTKKRKLEMLRESTSPLPSKGSDAPTLTPREEESQIQPINTIRRWKSLKCSSADDRSPFFKSRCLQRLQ